MGNRLKGVPEKYQKIDIPVGNLGADLLIPAQRSTLEFVNLNAQFLFQYGSGRSGGIHPVMGQKNPVKLSPFHQILLLIVVSNKGDLFIWFHFYPFINHKAPVRCFVLRISGRYFHRLSKLSLIFYEEANGKMVIKGFNNTAEKCKICPIGREEAND
jgi:hypothetical protein